MSQGPPPVPGGRTPEEREAARRERELRRTRRSVDGNGEPVHDWREQAERLTVPETTATPDKRPRARRPRVGRLVALCVVVAIAAGIGWFAFSLFQPFKGEAEGQPVSLRIPEGASLGRIADQLEAEGVISSSGFFQLRARLSGASGDLKPGAYRLSEDMSFGAALDALTEGVPPNVVMVSIPEGRSRREIAQLTRRLDGNYVRATRRSRALDPRDYKAPGPRSLEGFLFPATYELKKGQPVKALVREQLAAFKRNFAKVDLRYARRKNLTPYDVLIIASLIDREAAVARERPLIASVIYNRLRDNINLGIDATVRFATGNWTQPLKQSELANPSPYNTRVNLGLPPGPIGNPGLASIRAAARPAKTGFLFYVVKPGTCGRHNFAKTDAEFQRYVDEYDRARAERGGKSPDTC
jgi:UPF0755 protein